MSQIIVFLALVFSIVIAIFAVQNTTAVDVQFLTLRAQTGRGLSPGADLGGVRRGGDAAAGRRARGVDALAAPHRVESAEDSRRRAWRSWRRPGSRRRAEAPRCARDAGAHGHDAGGDRLQPRPSDPQRGRFASTFGLTCLRPGLTRRRIGRLAGPSAWRRRDGGRGLVAPRVPSGGRASIRCSRTAP